MKSLFLSEFDTTIRYHEIKGEGRPVIYLAALSLPSLPNFLFIATHPAMAGRHSILIDYLGVGHSDHPEGFDYSLENHAKTIADVLDHENLKNCIVIGHSMGGTVGILLAMDRPDLVSHLFVCEGNLISGGGAATLRNTSVSEDVFANEFFPKMLDNWQKEGAGGDEMAAWRAGVWKDVSFRGMHKNSAALVNLNDELKSSFFKLPMKCTFVYGEHSLPENTGKITPDAPNPNELLANGISVGVVPNVGHMMVLNPDGFVEAVLSEL